MFIIYLFIGRILRAIAFTAAPHTCADYELPPSARYKDIVLKGARTSGLDKRYAQVSQETYSRGKRDLVIVLKGARISGLDKQSIEQFRRKRSGF